MKLVLTSVSCIIAICASIWLVGCVQSPAPPSSPVAISIMASDTLIFGQTEKFGIWSTHTLAPTEMYEWDFGDGSVAHGHTTSLYHTYYRSGNVTVMVTLIDTASKAVLSTATKKIWIAASSNTPPSFTMKLPDSVGANIPMLLTVAYHPIPPPGFATRVDWGDGTSDIVIDSGLHAYATIGNYKIRASLIDTISNLVIQKDSAIVHVFNLVLDLQKLERNHTISLTFNGSFHITGYSTQYGQIDSKSVTSETQTITGIGWSLDTFAIDQYSASGDTIWTGWNNFPRSADGQYIQGAVKATTNQIEIFAGGTSSSSWSGSGGSASGSGGGSSFKIPTAVLIGQSDTDATFLVSGSNLLGSNYSVSYDMMEGHMSRTTITRTFDLADKTTHPFILVRFSR